MSGSSTSKLNPIKNRQKTTTRAVVLAAGAVIIIIGMISIYPTAYNGPSSSAAYAAAETFTQVVKIPVDATVSVECAAGGAGEQVHLTGEQKNVIHVTIDNAGGLHAKLHGNLQGVSGTGLTTGDKYQATGVINAEFNGKLGEEQTFVRNVHIVGQGNGNNSLIHVLFHITVNPNGSVTAFVDILNVECR